MKTLITGSSTRTIRAHEALKKHGITARIRRLDSTGEGCARGLAVEDGQADKAIRILADMGIRVRIDAGQRP